MVGSIIQFEGLGLQGWGEDGRAPEFRLKSTLEQRSTIDAPRTLIRHKHALAITPAIDRCCNRQWAGATQLTSRDSLVYTQKDYRNR